MVPIYELGTFADKRPYFSMKLLKGQTLADLLPDRSEPADDLPRFLSIFAAVAHTMAYSHTRGVIHRDLKPSNVMVGSFGEVQVMDWGLAKVLPRGGVVDDAKAGKQPPAETLIATARSGSDADLSHAGSVMGTPSYMAPEQARGENERIDPRSDVFALGSILGEILTGSPAFTGRNSNEILRKAGRRDTSDALARLDACGAEAELIALVKDCLAVEPEDRPRDAKVVSDRITAYLAGVQARVQAAERERAVAVARAVEERRRRKVQLALAASVLALTTLGGLSTTYYLQQRAERAHQRAEQAAAVDRVVGQAATLRDQAKANPEDVSRWQVALAAVEQTQAGGDASAHDHLLALRTEIQAGLDAAQRDKALLDRLVDIRSAEADDPDGTDTDAAYADSFREAGIDLATLPPAEAGARIRARPPSVTLALSAALDDWAATRRGKMNDGAGAARLSEASRVADPDPWRIELRKALDQSDKAARLTGLQALAKTAKFDELGAISLELLGTGLSYAGGRALAESVLRTAQQKHPRDVWVNYSLGNVLENLARRDEAIRFYTAERSIRPEMAHELAHLLEKRGESDDAIAVFRDLKRLRPGNARHLGCLGQALKAKGLAREAVEMLDAAVAAGREAIRLKPNSSQAHHSFGHILRNQGKLDEAIAEFCTAIRLKPGDAWAHDSLGVTLCDFKRDYPAAEAAFREAIRLGPNSAHAHAQLGVVLETQGKHDEAVAAYREAIRLEPDQAWARINMGYALGKQGKLDEAIDEFRTAIRLRPDDANAHVKFGSILCDFKRDYPSAEAEFREVIRLQANDATAHYCLGNALNGQGKGDEAMASFRKAIELNPKHAEAHVNIGFILLHVKRDYPAAEAEFREAIRLNPDVWQAHLNLGEVLKCQGRFAESLAAYQRGHELGMKQPGLSYPFAESVRDAERAVAMDGKLPEFLRGEFQPKDTAERLGLAAVCQAKKLNSAAARLYADALAADPKLADDLKAAHRHNAACAAALAGCGQAKDDPPPDESTRAELRGRALDWLRADLALRRKQLDTDPAAARRAVDHWTRDPDLAGVRDRDAIENLPADERRAWQALWNEVDMLLKGVAKPEPTASKPDGAAPVRQAQAPAESRPTAPPRQSLAPATP
jgi:serine/threonine-protein kinase